MKTPKTQEQRTPSVASSALLGRCVEAGDDDNGQPMMLIHTTRDALMRQVRNVVFEDVAVIRADELDTAVVVAFDGQARTITLRFDLMPCAAIGERWLVRPKQPETQESNPERPPALAGARGSAAKAAKELGLEKEYAAFVTACNDARHLAHTWNSHAAMIDQGDLKLGLESCASDLNRLAASWMPPNEKAQ